MKKSIWFWALAAGLSWAVAGVHPAQAQTPAQPARWVLVDDLRVRSGPRPESKVDGTLMRGAQVTLKGSQVDDFCLIEGEGQYGYVACRYLSAKLVARAKAGENGVDAAQRWISGNAVTLRAGPNPSATVVGRFPLNATVLLLREDAGSGYCEVKSAEGRQGHVACRYLTPTPTVLAHVQGLGKDGVQSPDYDPERAFWLEPGWNSLVQYAEHLKRSFVGPRMDEPWPANEALDRMKAHLALGIKGRKPAPYPDWIQLKRKASQLTNEQQTQNGAHELRDALGLYGELHDARSAEGARRVVRLVRALEFPTVGPSLFRSESEIAPPHTSAEEASGRFGMVFRQVISPRPKPKPGLEDAQMGFYDMRSRTQALVAPVWRVRLFREGELHIEPSFVTRKEDLWYEADEPECQGWTPGFAFGDADAGVWRFFDGDSADPLRVLRNTTRRDSQAINPAGSLYAFYTAQKLKIDRATHVEVPMKMDRGETGFVRGTSHYFDLDADGIHDLAVWEGQGKGPGHLDGSTKTDDRWYRLVMVNVAGAWKVLGSDVFSYGCGC
jgi:uncharacterized protein YraI